MRYMWDDHFEPSLFGTHSLPERPWIASVEPPPKPIPRTPEPTCWFLGCRGVVRGSVRSAFDQTTGSEALPHREAAEEKGIEGRASRALHASLGMPDAAAARERLMSTSTGEVLILGRLDSMERGRSTTPSLLVDLQVSSWGRKEGSVFGSLKSEVDDAAAQWESRDVPTRGSDYSRLGARSSACATPLITKYTMRPRFCHDMRCEMFGTPYYADAQVRKAVCQRCGGFLVKNKPSMSWQRILEPESGPVLHTAAWKTSPALPAPELGSGYGAGRKVHVGQWLRPPRESDSQEGHGREDGRPASPSEKAPVSMRLKMPSDSGWQVHGTIADETSACSGPAIFSASWQRSGSRSSSTASGSKYTVSRRKRGERLQQKASDAGSGVDSTVDDVVLRDMMPPSQKELAQLDPDLKAIFDDHSDDASSGGGSRPSSRGVGSRHLSRLSRPASRAGPRRPASRGTARVEVQSPLQSGRSSPTVYGGYTQHLRENSAKKETESSNSRPSTNPTRVTAKSLASSVALSRRLWMAGVCGPSQEIDPIDANISVPSLRPLLYKPSCSDSLLIYRQNERAASEADTLRSNSALGKGVEEASDVSRPLSTEHRWGANATAMSRSKKISNVVRAHSTPPVLPKYILKLMIESGDTLSSSDMSIRATSESVETISAIHLNNVWAIPAVEADSLTGTIEEQHRGLEEDSGYSCMDAQSDEDEVRISPVPGSVYYAAAHEESGTRLDDLRDHTEVLEHRTNHGAAQGTERSRKRVRGARPGTADNDRKANALVGRPRPATSAGLGPSGNRLLQKEMLKESESFGLLMRHDSLADSLLPVGVAAQHRGDFHTLASFGSGKHGKGIFSRPKTRQSSPVSPSRMSGHLASAGLVGENKALICDRPESPRKLGAKVKARPKAGLKTVARERAHRRESPPPSGRKSPSSPFPSALYIDVDKNGVLFQAGKGHTERMVSTAPILGPAKSKARTEQGKGVNSGGTLIAVFPPSPQVRAVLSRMGLSEFASPLVGKGQSEVVFQHLQHLENYGYSYTHVGTRTSSLSSKFTPELEGEASWDGVANRTPGHEFVGISQVETMERDSYEEKNWDFLKIDGQALTGEVRERQDEVPQARTEEEEEHGPETQQAPARQLGDTDEAYQPHSDEEEEEEPPRQGPVMQYLGDNDSHPVHLVGTLQHQAKHGKETLFCSLALNYTRERRRRSVDPKKWGKEMEASVDAAQQLAETSFWGRSAGRLSAQNDVSQTQAAKAAKIFAMQPENMPQVREDLQRRKLQRVLSEWFVAAKESRIEKSLHANLYPRFHPVPTPEKATGLHVATQGASGDVHGGNIVGYVGRNSGSSSDTRPKTVSVRHGTQAAGDEARFKASSTGRGSRSGSRCGAPHVVSTDYDLKSAEKRAKGVEYTGRETMSKQAKMNALLALYQQRHLPAMSTKLTSDLL